MGKREELRSLGTKDPAEARVRYAKVSAEVEARWASLRAGARSLTEAEAHAIARTAYDTWLEWHRDEPSEQFAWTPRLYRHLWLQSPPVKKWPEGSVPADNLLVKAMREFCFVQADNGLGHHGLVVDEFSRLKLAKAMGAAFQRASLTLEDLAEGRVLAGELPPPSPGTGFTGGISTDASAVTPSAAKGRRSSASPPTVTMTGIFKGNCSRGWLKSA